MLEPEPFEPELFELEPFEPEPWWDPDGLPFWPTTVTAADFLKAGPVTVGRMPHRPPLGLFDNEVRLYSLDELTETVRLLERGRPGCRVQKRKPTQRLTFRSHPGTAPCRRLLKYPDRASANAYAVIVMRLS